MSTLQQRLKEGVLKMADCFYCRQWNPVGKYAKKVSYAYQQWDYIKGKCSFWKIPCPSIMKGCPMFQKQVLDYRGLPKRDDI